MQRGETLVVVEYLIQRDSVLSQSCRRTQRTKIHSCHEEQLHLGAGAAAGLSRETPTYLHTACCEEAPISNSLKIGTRCSDSTGSRSFRVCILSVWVL